MHKISSPNTKIIIQYQVHVPANVNIHHQADYTSKKEIFTVAWV